MTFVLVSHANPLIRKLDSIVRLSNEERYTVENLSFSVREVGAGEAIVNEGDSPSRCCLVLSGLACRSEMLEDGRRQILSFHINGDLPDLNGLHLDAMDHDVGMLQAGKIGFIPHNEIRAMNERHSRIEARSGGTRSSRPPSFERGCSASAGSPPMVGWPTFSARWLSWPRPSACPIM